MDIKVASVEKDILDKMFSIWLTDIKTKFIAIKNVFKLVLEGVD